MATDDSEPISRRKKIDAILDVARYKPRFTAGIVLLGVSAVMVARHTTSFAVAWLREAVRTYYIRDLQDRAFRNALNARVEYFDEESSDDILNVIVTQTYHRTEYRIYVWIFGTKCQKKPVVEIENTRSFKTIVESKG